MMTILAYLVFAAAFAAVCGIFAFTLVPALPRIAALLRGELPTAPEARLVLRDRLPRQRQQINSAPVPQRVRAAA